MGRLGGAKDGTLSSQGEPRSSQTELAPPKKVGGLMKRKGKQTEAHEFDRANESSWPNTNQVVDTPCTSVQCDGGEAELAHRRCVIRKSESGKRSAFHEKLEPHTRQVCGTHHEARSVAWSVALERMSSWKGGVEQVTSYKMAARSSSTLFPAATLDQHALCLRRAFISRL